MCIKKCIHTTILYTYASYRVSGRTNDNLKPETNEDGWQVARCEFKTKIENAMRLISIIYDALHSHVEARRGLIARRRQPDERIRKRHVCGVLRPLAAPRKRTCQKSEGQPARHVATCERLLIFAAVRAKYA